MGNGVTASFPLPEGADGSEVWLSLPGGRSVRMEQGGDGGYTVLDGAVCFSVPPPEGSLVLFERPEEDRILNGTGVCIVAYPDGTLRELASDPWELLERAQRTLDEARAEREALRRQVETEGAAVRALAAEAKAELESRILNYSALVEEAVDKAAASARSSVRRRMDAELDELKAARQDVASARAEIRSVDAELRSAKSTAAIEAAATAAEEVHGCCEEALEAWERIRALRPELEELAARARAAASEAGREVTEDAGRRADVLMEELRAIRGRLERDLERETVRAEKRHAAEISVMERLRDEATWAAKRSMETEAACLRERERTEAAEERARSLSERIIAFETAWNSRILREMEERRSRDAQ